MDAHDEIPCPFGVILQDDRTKAMIVVATAYEVAQAQEVAQCAARGYRRWLISIGKDFGDILDVEVKNGKFHDQILESMEYAYDGMYTCRIGGRDFTILAPTSFIVQL